MTESVTESVTDSVNKSVTKLVIDSVNESFKLGECILQCASSSCPESFSQMFSWPLWLYKHDLSTCQVFTYCFIIGLEITRLEIINKDHTWNRGL